jgi:hypothetical protein
MKQFIYKIEPLPNVKQMYVFNIDEDTLVSIWMVIVHNDIESKIILNIKDIIEDCKLSTPTSDHIMHLVRELFGDMPSIDNLINMEIEQEDDAETIIAAADEAIKSSTTEYDDIVKQMRGE